jgi:pyrimidine deaminase RibD-like protein
MQPDAEYLMKLLTAFQGAPNPTTDIRELEGTGLSIDDPKFEFHMKLLQDGGFVESELVSGEIGLSKSADGSIEWSVIPLRLTASGHEFAEAMGNSKALQSLKKNFVGASITKIRDVAVAIFNVEVERRSDESNLESHRKRQAQLKALPARILSVLIQKPVKIQIEELKDSLLEFSDLPDSDWYATINDLLSDGMIDARVVRSGIYDAVGAAYNIGITQRERALTPDSPIESKPLREAHSEIDDRRFARLAIEEARKSVPEDERVHPRVGVVIVKDGRVLATAHRGEIPQCHAEFIGLEKKLAEVPLAGSTVYTTLEPCTSRNHPKVPCAIRLAERKVARVVIGMLDPDDRISGRGQRSLRKAGIATELFDHDLMTEIEELNRDFIRERENPEHRISASDERDTNRSPVPIPAQTEAARRLCDATRDLQKASWSYVELHSRYGVAQAARDVAAEEGKILEKIEVALQIFERDYDLSADLARVATEELANINISLDRLTAGHDLDTTKIAAEQIQDSCNRVREAAKPYAYFNRDAGDARRVQETELPAARPTIVPKRYGKGVLKDDMGYTGLAVVNDGEQPGYDLTIQNIQLKDGTKLVFHRGHTERLTRSDGEAFYPAFLEARLGGTFGSGLFDFMRERGVPSITVPITYRDSSNNWFQTDVTFERDVQKSGGLRLGWTQKRIPDPNSEAMTISPAATSIVIEPAHAVTRNVERVLSVMTERKNWRRTDLAKLANIGDDDALQALRALKDADKVIPIDVDEEPKDTFWRRT